MTGKTEWPFLRDVIKDQAAGLQIAWAPNERELEYTCGGQDVSKTRLIVFCSSVIVRSEILSLLKRPAYNFHPGPPSYPGVHSANFAIYESATRFGATAHVITQDIDAGPIVGVDWFDVPEGIYSDRLEALAYTSLFALFTNLAPLLVDIDNELPVLTESWSGRRRTYADFQALSKSLPLLSDEERQLRDRVLGT